MDSRRVVLSCSQSAARLTTGILSTSWRGPTPPARALPPWAGGGEGGGGRGGGGGGGGVGGGVGGGGVGHDHDGGAPAEVGVGSHRVLGSGQQHFEKYSLEFKVIH